MAKHWKSFVKKDESSKKKEHEELANIASLLSPEAKKSDKSLEDVAEFNSSLKSLIEEQKQLEEQMATLTGKKKKSSTDKKYEHEIKSIDQKKKEEAAAEKKLRKRKESNRKKHDDRWEVTPTFNKVRKEKDIFSAPPVFQKRKTAKSKTDFIQKHKKVKTTPLFAQKKKATNAKFKRKPKTKVISTKKKEATSLLDFGEKIQEGIQFFDTFTKQSKKLKSKVSDVDIENLTSKRNKRQNKETEKGIDKQQTFLSPKKVMKPIKTVRNTINKASKAMDTFDTVGKKVSKVNDTFQTIQQTGTTLQTGINKVANVVKSPELQKINKKVTKGMGIINKVGNKLNKVDQLFNTANKKLDKTRSVTNLFDKKLKAVDFISKNDASTKNGFDFDFIQQQQIKQEETVNFDIADRKLNVNLNTIKNIKNDIDSLKNMKKQKDSFLL